MSVYTVKGLGGGRHCWGTGSPPGLSVSVTSCSVSSRRSNARCAATVWSTEKTVCHTSAASSGISSPTSFETNWAAYGVLFGWFSLDDSRLQRLDDSELARFCVKKVSSRSAKLHAPNAELLQLTKEKTRVGWSWLVIHTTRIHTSHY